MTILIYFAAFLVISCDNCVLGGPGGKTQVKVRKCCPEKKMLDYSQECVEIERDKNFTFAEEVLKKVYDTSKKDWVSDDLEVVTNVTGTNCDAGDDYFARVIAVLTDDSLVLDLMNRQVITQQFSCIDHVKTTNDLVAIVCHDTIATTRGIVNKCCPHGQAVDLLSRQCEDKTDDEEDNFLSNTPVLSRWTGLPTKVWNVTIVQFDSLCETGHAVHEHVGGITSDGYAYNDNSHGVEVEYACVDMYQGDVMAWTCTGNTLGVKLFRGKGFSCKSIYDLDLHPGHLLEKSLFLKFI